VITSAAAFGRDLEDPFEAPGLDSHRATELLAQAGSAEVGLGADVVLTPRDPETSFFDSPAARADVARIQEAVAALPKVLGTTDPAAALRAGRQTAVESEVVSPDGEVALIRIQYPERQHLEPDDLANVQGAHEAPGRAEPFRRLVPAHRRSQQGPHRPRHFWAPPALRAAGRVPGLPHRRGRAQHGPAPAVMTSPGDEKGDHNHDHLHPTT
jgi:hypothetical protein